MRGHSEWHPAMVFSVSGGKSMAVPIIDEGKVEEEDLEWNRMIDRVRSREGKSAKPAD